MNMEDISSGEDLAQYVVNHIMDVELSFPPHLRISSPVLNYWIENIQESSSSVWVDYITGKREQAMFSIDELEDLYKKACEKRNIEMVETSLLSLFEKDLVEISVSETGELLYKSKT